MKTNHPSQSQQLSTLLQIHHIIRPHRLAPPNHSPSAIDSKGPRLLPLVAQHSRRTIVISLFTRSPRASHVGGLHVASFLNGFRNLFPQPALFFPTLHLGRRVEYVPHVGGAETPRSIDGAVFINDDLDVPCAAEDIDPFTGRLFGGVADCDAGYCLAVTIGERSQVEKGFLRD